MSFLMQNLDEPVAKSEIDTPSSMEDGSPIDNVAGEVVSFDLSLL